MADIDAAWELDLLRRMLGEFAKSKVAEIALCPQYVQGKEDAYGNGRGYKLYKPGENPQRRLNLILDRYSSDGSQYLVLKEKIMDAIDFFWKEGNTIHSWSIPMTY